MAGRLDVDRLAIWVYETVGLNEFARRSGIDRGTLSKDLRHQHPMKRETEEKVLAALQHYGIDPAHFLLTPAEDASDAHVPVRAGGSLQMLDSLRPLDALPGLARLEAVYTSSDPAQAARVAQSRPWKLSSLADFDGVIEEARRIKGAYASAMSSETAIELERMQAVAHSTRGEFVEADRAFRRLLEVRDAEAWPRYSPPVEHFMAKNYGRQVVVLIERDRRRAQAAYGRAIEYFDQSDEHTDRDPRDPRTGWNDLHRARLITYASDVAPKPDRDRVAELLRSAATILRHDGVGELLVRLETVLSGASTGESIARIRRETRAIANELLRREHLSGAAASLAYLASLHAQMGFSESARTAIEEAAAAYCLVPYEWFWGRVHQTLVMARHRLGSSTDYQKLVQSLRVKAHEGTGDFWVLDVKRLSDERRVAVVEKVLTDVARQRMPGSVATS